MVEVRVIENKEDWNSQLKNTVNYNIFSTYEWGNYKSANWKVERLAFYKSGNYLGQCQFLIKYKFGLALAWNSGGINYVNAKYLSPIIDSIREYYKDYIFNFRFNFYDNKNGENLFNILPLLTIVSSKINSGFSIVHYLEKDIDYIKNMNSNHRYYYKKALKNNLKATFSSTESITDFVDIHNNMTRAKDLQKLRINHQDIINLSNAFNKNFLIETIYFEEKVVASCLILIFEDCAFYYLAASNEDGRKLFASYFMIKELLDYLTINGIKRFDFAGITPYEQSANGVNKFKVGFGGKIVNYLGEFELFNNKLVNVTFNKLIKYII
ncbi:peptidoglycan bridge formation glycyltransferase FemA/FemB family protein [uncultured Arcobacter sp.]|uniref:lipid II:glycine glycyltransferase FemX n=1 Tax=uncultured Arcobacter sp. TaxID=165434 RepID=UPI00262FDFD6|nr:peptidoglycan bridge formation glycyltransferase FemA/FemB family protein [uncultured Arcobacter sp.]